MPTPPESHNLSTVAPATTTPVASAAGNGTTWDDDGAGVDSAAAVRTMQQRKALLRSVGSPRTLKAMGQDIANVITALRQLHDAEDRLRALNVVRSRKVTSDLGEWYGSVLLGARRVDNQSQKGHDLIGTSGTRYQVKTNRKAPGSGLTVWVDADVGTQEPAPFDELLIFDLGDGYLVRRLFRVPRAEINVTNFGPRRKDGKLNLSARRLEGYQVHRADLPRNGASVGAVQLFERDDK